MIIGIDPGNKTGIALDSKQGLKTHTIEGDRSEYELWLLLNTVRVQHTIGKVVIERIKPVSRFGMLEQAYCMLGIAKLFCSFYGWELIVQDSQMRIPYLRQAIGHNKHERDAHAHIEAYIAKRSRGSGGGSCC